MPDSLKDIELWVSRVSGVPVADIKPQYKLGGGTKRKGRKGGDPKQKDSALLAFMSIVANILHDGASGGASGSAGAGEVPDVWE